MCVNSVGYINLSSSEDSVMKNLAIYEEIFNLRLIPEANMLTPRQMASLCTSDRGSAETASNLAPPHRFDTEGNIINDRPTVVSDSSTMLKDKDAARGFMSVYPTLNNTPGLEGVQVVSKDGATVSCFCRWLEALYHARGIGPVGAIYQRLLRTEKDDNRLTDLMAFADGSPDYWGEVLNRRVRERLWEASSCAGKPPPEFEWHKENIFLASMHDLLIVGWLANELRPWEKPPKRAGCFLNDLDRLCYLMQYHGGNAVCWWTHDPGIGAAPRSGGG